MKAASLCTGYGGLDLAAADVLDIEHAWFAEYDPDASKILAHRYPHVPNLGDITAIDWTQVEPVDLLTAGYPCQPLSLAGRRGGLDDERWLWDDGVFPAIRDLRPGIVVLENVPGHLSMGFGRVLGDLAAIGYDASWVCVRASDVGAPHRRERVFILAQPADAAGARLETRRQGWAGVGAVAGDSGNGRAGGLTLLPTPQAADGNGGGRYNSVGHANTLPGTVRLLPTPRATDGTKGGPNQRGSSGDLMLPSAVQLLPTPTATPYGYNQGGASPDGPIRLSLDSMARTGRWGEYGPAIARWEHVTGRPAPEPTEPGAKGGRRLAPRFVEFLMGLDAGWVTDVPGLTRNAQLKALGNGVVPQQGAHALATLFDAQNLERAA